MYMYIFLICFVCVLPLYYPLFTDHRAKECDADAAEPRAYTIYILSLSLSIYIYIRK